MESYCLKCKKHTENIDPNVSASSNGRVMILSKRAICGSKKSRFIKHQEAKGLLSKLGIKTPLSKVLILGDILFWMQFNWTYIKNEWNSWCLLAGDTFMSEMHLKQPAFTYSACGPFTKNKETNKNLKKQEIQTTFTKMNLIRLVFNMIWLVEILKI